MFSALLTTLGTVAFAQDAPTHSIDDPNKLYVGLGFGLDHGGIGAKIEYQPIRTVGVFAGLGYNLAEVGWNVGASYKIIANKILTINPTAFYGYNAVLEVEGAPEYDKVSYGMTLGVNLDFHLGKNGNKLVAGLFVPIRSQKFLDHYDRVKDDPRVVMDTELIPIAVSVGYNFRIK